MIVRGYREKGNIDTPLELAIRNGTDRFSLAIEAIDQLSKNGTLKDGEAGRVREGLLNEQLKARDWAFENGVDMQEIVEWKWPFGTEDEDKEKK